MIPEIGLFCVILVLAASLLQTLPLFSRGALALSLSVSAPVVSFTCASLAMLALIMAFMHSDFSVSTVVENSHTDKPLLYKITGAWGNHEGSMLLWLWVLTFFGWLFSGSRLGDAPEWFRQRVLAVQGAQAVGIAMFILYATNPFRRVFPPPVNGNDLNPLLQDIGIAIHPPMLYLGYVGFSLVFSLAVAGLLSGAVGKGWARLAHPWIMIAWSALTLGIGLGSWWAYRELGWGGFWFWDPVENASLMPWLAGTALLHANVVLMRRGALAHWVLLLAILTFSLSMFGTFLVRSGILTSVHSFASDPTRGLYLLLYMTMMTGTALFLFARRGAADAAVEALSPLSRGGQILVNNLFLLTACATVLLATIYPMLSDVVAGKAVAVGAPYFNLTVLPLLALALVFAGLAPFLSWKRSEWSAIKRHIVPQLLAVLAILPVAAWLTYPAETVGLAGIALAIWVASSSFRIFLSALPGQGSFMQRLRHVPLSRYAVAIAHLGAACLILGVAGTTWQGQNEAVLPPGGSLQVQGVTFTLDDVDRLRGPNYRALKGYVSVGDIALTPEERLYEVRGVQTSEAAIHSSLWRDLYAVIGATNTTPETFILRIYINPLMTWLWLGFILMAAGGMAAAASVRKPVHD